MVVCPITIDPNDLGFPFIISVIQSMSFLGSAVVQGKDRDLVYCTAGS